MICILRHHLSSSQLKWNSRHVRGHQEDFKAWAELTWCEKHNVRMDHAAKDKMLCPWAAPSQHVSSHEGWSFWKGQQKRTCRLLVAMDLVDWEVLAKACDAESPGQLQWVTKHVTGVCGVGKFLERWKSEEHSRCPGCDAENEDHQHVYLYPARSTKRE
jgi:hypothetical protein